jgi:TPP-dependent pyruvate/acetoin dehydrogenase alpha subunit
VAIDLLPDDTVVAAGRDFAIDFMKGASLTSIFRSLFARADLPHLAAQLNVATSVALANKMKKNGKIAVIFSSDGYSSSECWHKSLARAGSHRLPLLIVSHHNPPADPQSFNGKIGVEEIGLKAQTLGLPVITVDGNDVVAVYRVATEAIAHARRGNGPTLIECKVERQKVHDPILKMETYLTLKGLFSEEMKLKAVAGFTKELDTAIEAAEAPPFPEGAEEAAKVLSC